MSHHGCGSRRAIHAWVVPVLPLAALGLAAAAATDQRDFLNGPDFQKLFDQRWASSKPMKYRAWREYRDRHRRLVLLWNGDEYPDLTRAIERTIPGEAREGMQPSDLVRSPVDTAWCAAKGTESFLVCTMDGRPVALDLGGAAGPYSISWLDAASGASRPGATSIAGGGVVTISPPDDGARRAWVGWVKKK